MTPRMDMICLITDDMAASLAFYQQLGVPMPADGASGPHVEATFPDGLRIAWETVESVRAADPEYQPRPEGTRLSLAFRCDSPAEVDALYERLLAAGHSGLREPWDAFWGQRYAVVRDPDGNAVDLFAWQP
ncbi:VOC family protein [Streptomyces sp. DSM 44915]|uniref:VOC family protein n=1 Tax=Streptomyces chisholmiae TaxID=3075540 RepID=A0ABU2JQ03_9ACTN|nr:VOC family protein [Streptomyces sp. DSM 44915]MDT0267075.1 VOC family protein [Streptomyces sp. DSM 44915]